MRSSMEFLRHWAVAGSIWPSIELDWISSSFCGGFAAMGNATWTCWMSECKKIDWGNEES